MLCIATGKRVLLREVQLADAGFLLELLNEPGWRAFIADHDIRSLDQARGYIVERLQASYQQNGHGLWLMELRHAATPIGLCGLVRREFLADMDLGFAVLERHQGLGLVREAAEAALEYARSKLRATRVDAITLPNNHRSISLLTRLGFTCIGDLEFPGTGELLQHYRRHMTG